MNNKLTLYILALVLLVASVFYFTKDKKEDITSPLPSDFVSLRPAISALPSQELSTEERDGLIFMREEEKLARDVYITLYEKWNVPIFQNISQSEQTHTEAVQNLLVKYSVPDPVTNDSVGVFVNQDLGKLYTDLVKQGELSVNEALAVGAFIEDLDISDLEKFIAKTDNEDIKLVYGNLSRGSRNHLRSFVSQLTSRGGTYEPKYISQENFDEIISTPRETGTGGRGWGR